MSHTCNYCVMDSFVPGIIFDHEGNCNYCRDFRDLLNRNTQRDIVESTFRLNNFVQQVKKDGKGKRYDCIVGVSGGVDSSWVLFQAVQAGLRPLAVHMDNGWNSELAQSNIECLVRTLDVDLFTHVIDWTEYRELMLAFFDADVVDVELLYDNAMLALNYKIARKFKIGWILAGTNAATEGMKMPPGWNWMKYDRKNIMSIAKRRGIRRFNTFPSISVFQYVLYQYFLGYKWISFLDFLDYNKENAIRTLEKECGYKPYPYKHYESIFTRFYQGYILPKKFQIDKRKVHLSTLVVSGQMVRCDALRVLEKLPLEDENQLVQDIEFFIKKMGWTHNELESYLMRPAVSHQSYGSEIKRWKILSHIFRKLYSPGNQ